MGFLALFCLSIFFLGFAMGLAPGRSPTCFTAIGLPAPTTLADIKNPGASLALDNF